MSTIFIICFRSQCLQYTASSNSYIIFEAKVLIPHDKGEDYHYMIDFQNIN
jgi:hypothetical protein